MIAGERLLAMHPDKHEVISAGLAEAAKMKTAVAQAGAGARVTMHAAQFSVLAALVENLCEIANGTVSGDLGDPRYWVPLGEYVKLKQDRQRLLAEQAAFNVSLSGWNDPAVN